MDFAEDVWDSRRVSLTQDAARFLQLVRRLGHLAPDQEEALLQELSPAFEAFDDVPVVLDRDAVRRMTASWLFRSQLDLDRDQLLLLAREWALLFS